MSAVVLRRVRPSWVRTLAALALSLGVGVVAVGCLEAAVGLAGIDRRLVARSLFLQAADLPVHRVSDDPFLHYDLAPGSRFENAGPHGVLYSVNVDEFGARQPTHSRVKSPGTFRILCFGGSTMYGAGIDDGQTIPARLEAHLNRDPGAADPPPVRFEAWNFGTSAYTLGQATHLAEKKLSELDPDVILVQHHNVGRRPFLGTPDMRVAGQPPELDHPDVDFFLEQFPVPSMVPMAWHGYAVAHSALYRSLIALSPHLAGMTPDWECDRCNQISAAKARALSREAEARGVPVVYVAIPADRGVPPRAIFRELSATRLIDLYQPGREADFYEVHPPPAILDEYAQVLAKELRQRGLLSARDR
jgi:hypothetical protein